MDAGSRFTFCDNRGGEFRFIEVPAMDFQLSADLQALRDRIRAFIRTEVVPLESLEQDEEGLPLAALSDIRRKAKTAGVWAPQLPREYGGLGLNTMGLCVLFEEAGYSPLGP